MKTPKEYIILQLEDYDQYREFILDEANTTVEFDEAVIGTISRYDYFEGVTVRDLQGVVAHFVNVRMNGKLTSKTFIFKPSDYI